MNRKNYIRIIAAACIVFVLLWAVANLTSLRTVTEKVIEVLIPIIVGGCIAFILNIPLRLIERLWIRLFKAKRRGLRRTVSIILCYLLAIGLVALLIGLVIPQIWETAQGIFTRIPFYIERLNGWYARLAKFLTRFSFTLPTYHFNPASIMSAIKTFVSENSNHIIGTSVSLVSAAFGIIFDGLFALVISIYILAQKEKLSAGIKKILYSIFSEKNAERLLAFARLSEKTFSGFVTGQLTEALILGVLCFIGMLIFGIPYPLLCSVLVGVTALIPIFGAFIGTGIGAFLILFESPLKAVLFVIFIIVLQQVEGNVIYPRVVGSQVGLPGLWVLIAVTVGSEFGIFGMLLAVPLVSLAYTLVRQIVDARIREKGLESEFSSNEEKPSKKKREKKKRKNNKNDNDEAAGA